VPEVILQRLDLMADRCLGHGELGRRPRETQMAAGRFEGSEARQRRQAARHEKFILRIRISNAYYKKFSIEAIRADSQN